MAKVKVFIGVFEAMKIGEHLYYGYDIAHDDVLMARKIGFTNPESAREAAVVEESSLDKIFEFKTMPGKVVKFERRADQE